MPVARMRSRGQLLELGLTELKFTLAETREFIDGHTDALQDAALTALYERTEGWISGIKLATL